MIKIYGEKGNQVNVDKKVFNRVIKMIQQDSINDIGFKVSDNELLIHYTTNYSKGAITLKDVSK